MKIRNTMALSLLLLLSINLPSHGSGEDELYRTSQEIEHIGAQIRLQNFLTMMLLGFIAYVSYKNKVFLYEGDHSFAMRISTLPPYGILSLSKD